jgi:23S rRNA (guanine2445-N2)-methyltransferase / 23S rRNA (guanine2069-N7)-methyltransferase
MYDNGKEFRKIIKTRFQQLRKDLHPLKTNCMRVYDHNIAGIPASVELYDKYAKIAVYGDSELSAKQLTDTVSSMLYIPESNVFYQERKKHRGKIQQHTELVKPAEVPESRVVVLESGLKFIIDLGDRTDTGLFLDHMPTRVMVRENVFGCSVLNLFSYTGSFSVYAAAGGASRVASVDLSNTYSQWAEKNLQQNGFFGSRYPCIRSDVKAFLLGEAKDFAPYDLVICDPPSFSNSNKMKGVFDVQRDYTWYITEILKHTAPGGTIVFSSNLQGFHFDAGRIRGASCRNITKQTTPPGFSRKPPPHICWLISKGR